MKPEWNGFQTDLDRFKLPTKQLLQRRVQSVSANHRDVASVVQRKLGLGADGKWRRSNAVEQNGSLSYPWLTMRNVSADVRIADGKLMVLSPDEVCVLLKQIAPPRSVANACLFCSLRSGLRIAMTLA